MLTIYILRCPRTGKVRYVGKTHYELEFRLRAHLSEAGRKRLGHRGAWIRSLLRDGLTPIIELDCVVQDHESWQQVERERIEYYRSIGCDLVNGTAGGDGLCDPTPEVRARIGAAAKAYSATPEGKARARQGGLISGPKNKGKIRTPEQRARISAGHTGRIVSIETRMKMSAAQLKRTDKRGPQSEEARKRVSESLTGRTLTPEHRAKIAAGLRQRYAE